MDFFGIGAALKGVTNVYFGSARQTGRTTRLARIVKDGDLVVFLNSRDANEFRKVCWNYEKDIDISICPAERLELIFERSRAVQGRVYFDHRWEEAYYENELERSFERLYEIQNRLSLEPPSSSAMKVREDHQRFSRRFKI